MSEQCRWAPPSDDECPCRACGERTYFARAFDMHFWGEDCWYVCQKYEDWRLERMKTNADVKRGHWMYCDDGGFGTCSECGNTELIMDCGEFCRYCAARMKEGANK